MVIIPANCAVYNSLFIYSLRRARIYRMCISVDDEKSFMRLHAGTNGKILHEANAAYAKEDEEIDRLIAQICV